MIWPVLLALCGALADPYQVAGIPVSSDRVEVFAALADGDDIADLIVLDPNGHVTIVPSRSGASTVAIDLPPGSGAIDFADIDADGTPELVVVCREQVLSYELAAAPVPDPALLFTFTSRYTFVVNRPHPVVLVVERKGKPAIALPSETELIFFLPTGEKIDRAPLSVPSDSVERHFYVSREKDMFAGGATPFHVEGSGHIRIPAEAPHPAETSARNQRKKELLIIDPEGFWQAFDANDENPQRWPSFVLQEETPDLPKAFFRFSGSLSDSFDSTYADTVLRIQYRPDDDQESVILGDSRRYPGMLLPTDRRVDVNADGYTDIILAQTKTPGHSVDTITRTLASPTWPVRLTVHVYDPERHRYEGRPYGRIDTDIPPLKALLQGPQVFLKRLVSLDCNADARTDIGFIHQPRLFSIWTAEDTGFSSEPAFEFKSPTDMEKVVFQENLLPDGRTTLVIQGDMMVYVFRPALAPAAPESRLAE